MHLEPGRHHRHAIVDRAHPGRACLVIFRPRVVLYRAVPVLVAVLREAVALRQIDPLKLHPEPPHNRRVDQLLHDPDRLDHDAAIVLGGQVVAPDDGRVERVLAVERDATCDPSFDPLSEEGGGSRGVWPTFARRLKVQRRHPHRLFATGREVGDLRSRLADRLVTGEEYLDVGVVRGGQVRVPHARHLRQARARQRPRLVVQVQLGVGLVEGRVEILVQREVEAERLVVVQVLADARQVEHHGDPYGPKVRLGPYAGQHEQLGRVYRARGQDHLPLREHDPPLPVLRKKKERRVKAGNERRGHQFLTISTSTPVALLFSVLTFVTVAFTITCRFFRPSNGVRNALALLTRTPFLLIVWATVNPLIRSPDKSSETPNPASSAAFRISQAKGGWYGNLSHGLSFPTCYVARNTLAHLSTFITPPVRWYLVPTLPSSVLFSDFR